MSDVDQEKPARKRAPRPEALHAPHRFPRGYCREGHPIKRQTMLWGAGNLTPLHVTHEASETLQRQSLEIFTLMANSGRTFAECLSAILLTGVNWGVEASREPIA